jgi:hypothetical protein
VRLLRWVAYLIQRCAEWVHERADHAQVRHNKRLGVYHVTQPELSSRRVA